MPTELVNGEAQHVDDDAMRTIRATIAGTDMPDISDRQFARGLWGDDIITYPDFLGFIGPGMIPGTLQAIIANLPDDDTGAPTPRKDAIGFLTGAKTYQFNHPLVETLRKAIAATDAKWTTDYLKVRWLVWATL